MDEMRFDKQLKFYRKKHNFSQEILAEKLYVSRQTISNWETKKSLPDIHNLLLLSVLFEVSLDDLVKGEVEEMRNASDVRKYKGISIIRDGFMLISVFLMIAGRHYYGDYFSIIVAVTAIVFWVLSRFLLRKIEIKNNIHNSIYDPKESREVLMFLDNPNFTQEKLEEKRKTELKEQKLKSVLLFFGFLAFIFFSSYISR